MKKAKQKFVIGNIAVDSGQVLIVDPAYLGEWVSGDYPAKKGTKNHYAETCKVILEQGTGQLLIAGKGGFGVVAGTPYGDGFYPVIAHFDKYGVLAKIEIDFTDSIGFELAKQIRESKKVKKINKHK